MESDKEIIIKFLEGNESSFDELVHKYTAPVYNFLFRITQDQSLLDDLTQETFLKAWKNIKKFDQNKNFKTWIFTIAKNTAFDYLKKKKSIPFSRFLNEEGNSPLEEIEENNILQDEILEREDLARELEEKLEHIPPSYRLVLILHYKEDLSFQEISQVLGKHYNTIKSQHARALKTLKNILME